MANNWQPSVNRLRGLIGKPPLSILTPPPATPANLNQLVAPPQVTPANLPQWELVTGQGVVTSIGGVGMGNKKVSLLCLSNGAGFSESFYSLSAGMGYQDALTAGQAIVNARTGSNGLSNNINDTFAGQPDPNAMNVQYLRVSDETIQRDVLLQGAVNPAGKAYAPGLSVEGGLPAQSVMRVKFYQAATPGIFAITYLHCLPRNYINPLTRNGVWSANATLAIQHLLTALQSTQLGFRSQLTTGLGAPQIPATVAYGAGPQPEQYTFTGTGPWPTGKFVCIFRGFKSLRALNGRHVCQGVPAGTSFTLLKNFRNLGPWDGAGNVAPLIWTYFTPDSFALSWLTAKKCGRPFYLQRGRAMAKLS